MRVLICGDRNWTNDGAIRNSLRRLLAMHGEETIIIHGAAKGADSIAGEQADNIGLKVEPYPAQWNKYGRAAGPVRNRQMLTEGKPELVLAFHSDLDHSKGTADMVRIALQAGLIVMHYDGRDWRKLAE